jgi:acetone carboxylase, gamma subunit
MAEDKTVTKEIIADLVDGVLSDVDVEQLQRMGRKDSDRFWKYIEVLQERVPWSDRILLRLTDHLYIVQKRAGERIVKCDCGEEFGDYRVNWKLHTLVRTRRTSSEFEEVYTPSYVAPEPEWMTIREYLCPGCVAQLGVEAVPPGYPPMFDMLPDLDAFYREWLGAPLEDEDTSWFEDRTATLTAAWLRENSNA